MTRGVVEDRPAPQGDAGPGPPLAVRMRPRDARRGRRAGPPARARARRCAASSRAPPPCRRSCSGGRPAPARPPSPGSSSQAHRPRRSWSCPRCPPGSRRCARSSTAPAATWPADRRRTVLFLDEIHRFTKAQQDALLPARGEPLGAARRRDDREPVLLGGRPAAVAVAAADPRAARRRRPSACWSTARVADERGLGGAVTLDDRGPGPPRARWPAATPGAALTALEAAAGAARRSGRGAVIDLAIAGAGVDRAAVRYDRDGRPALRRASARSSSRSAARTSTPRCTTWPG